VVVVLASLTTCDPGNILRTLEALRDDRVRCSVVSLSAELHVCRTLCALTGGVHTVAVNEDHVREALMAHVAPPALAAAAGAEASLVGMGFPRRRQAAVATPCAWSVLRAPAAAVFLLISTHTHTHAPM
jgi:transcription initiation factor TFIIH subunit 2